MHGHLIPLAALPSSWLEKHSWAVQLNDAEKALFGIRIYESQTAWQTSIATEQ